MRTCLAAWMLVIVGCLVYSNSFDAPLVFDAQSAIIDNPTIRHLWPLKPLLLPPLPGTTVEGRPLLNLSFALNYAVGGLRPWGYHAVNLAIHLLAGLGLFGIVRRTLVLPQFRDNVGASTTGIALAVALVWVVHPLQTESVTNVVQRAESLVGLLYLLTFYCAVRSFGAEPNGRWSLAAIVTCFLGMAAKEVMVTAPLAILLYDRLFIAMDWRDLWKTRRGFYAGLFSSWALLAALVVLTGSHGKTVGVGFGVSPWDYALTQCGAIIRYLWLSVWPSPLILDYGVIDTPPLASALPAMLILLALLAASVAQLHRRPWIGFVGVCFFLILAPTSSVLPIVTQTLAEHRIYLPLAPLAALAVIGVYLLLEGRRLATPLAVLVVAVLGTVTYVRNRDYRSELAIWEDTVAKWPASWRSQNNLGFVLEAAGRVDDAIVHYQRAIALKPGFADGHYNLGLALDGKGRTDEAIPHYEEALKIRPDYAKAHNNLGYALFQKGRVVEALDHYRKALEIQPDNARALNNMGLALMQQGRIDEAVAHYEKAVAADPAYAKAHNNLANALLQRGRSAEAISHYETALRMNPGQLTAINNLAWVLATHPDGTVRNGARALELTREAARVSGLDTAKNSKVLAAALAESRRFDEAATAAQHALDLASAQNNAPMAAAIRNELACYKSGTPWRDASLAGRR